MAYEALPLWIKPAIYQVLQAFDHQQKNASNPNARCTSQVKHHNKRNQRDAQQSQKIWDSANHRMQLMEILVHPPGKIGANPGCTT